jgi:hypothetical protein
MTSYSHYNHILTHPSLRISRDLSSMTLGVIVVVDVYSCKSLRGCVLSLADVKVVEFMSLGWIVQVDVIHPASYHHPVRPITRPLSRDRGTSLQIYRPYRLSQKSLAGSHRPARTATHSLNEQPLSYPYLFGQAPKRIIMSTLNVSIADTSPLIQYYPYYDGSSQSGWNSSYTSNQPFVRDVIADGTSFHRTSFPGSLATLTFEGTDVWVWGEGDQSNYLVFCDSVQQDQDVIYGSLLGSCRGLGEGTHVVQLKMTGDQTTNGEGSQEDELIFYGMTLTAEVDPD